MSAIPGASIGAADLPSAAKSDDPAKAAKSLEAYFLRQVLSEVRKSSASAGQKSMFDGGFAGDTFKEMLDGALADAMAGSAGIAKTLQSSMEASSPKVPGMSKALSKPPAAPIPVSDKHAQRAYSLVSGDNVHKALKESDAVPNQRVEAPNAR